MKLVKVFVENKLVKSVLAVALFVTGYFLSVYFSFGYQSDNYNIGMTMMIGPVMIYLIHWTITNQNKKFKMPVSVVVLILIGIAVVLISSLVLFTDYAKQNYLRSELTKNGIKTTAVVTGFEYESIKSSTKQYATIQYDYENTIITQRIETYKDSYQIDQTIPIVYSSKHPEMFDIVKDD